MLSAGWGQVFVFSDPGEIKQLLALNANSEPSRQWQKVGSNVKRNFCWMCDPFVVHGKLLMLNERWWRTGRSVTLREQSVSFVVDPVLFYKTPHGPSWWCNLRCSSHLISYGTNLFWTKSLVHIFQVDALFTFSRYVCRVAFPKCMGLSGFSTGASLHSMRIWAFKNCKQSKRYRKYMGRNQWPAKEKWRD